MTVAACGRAARCTASRQAVGGRAVASSTTRRALAGPSAGEAGGWTARGASGTAPSPRRRAVRKGASFRVPGREGEARSLAGARFLASTGALLPDARSDGGSADPCGSAVPGLGECRPGRPLRRRPSFGLRQRWLEAGGVPGGDLQPWNGVFTSKNAPRSAFSVTTGCQFPDANLRCKRSFQPLSRAVRTVSRHGLLGEASSPGRVALAFAIPSDDVESRL
jgi:hypothetical protein